MPRFVTEAREVKRQIPNPNIHIDSTFPTNSFIDFDLVLREIQNEYADEDEFKIVPSSIRRSETTCEVQLKNGTTIRLQQERTPEGIRLKTDVNLNNPSARTRDNIVNNYSRLATALVSAECKAAGVRPGPNVKVYVEIKPNDPIILRQFQQAFRNKGFTVLDTLPELKSSAPSPRR